MSFKIKQKKKWQQRAKSRLRHNQNVYQILKAKITKNWQNHTKFRTRRTLPGETRMSDVLVEFAAPLLDVAMNGVACDRALFVAMIAWNIALLPEHKQNIEREKFVQSLSEESGESPEFVRDILEDLIHFKIAHYSHIRRLIVDFHRSGWGDNLHLVVASTPVLETV